MFKSRTFAGVVLAALAVCALMFAITPDAMAVPSVFGFDPNANHLLGFAAAGSIEQLRKLVAQRGALVTEMQAITSAAAAREDGNLTDDERTKIDAAAIKVTALDGDITRVKATMEAARGVELPAGAVIQTRDNMRDAPTHGFRSFGEFALACVQASGQGAAADERLQFDAASTAPGQMGQVGNGADGGYLVPPEFSQAIVETSYNDNQSFVPLTDNTPISVGNNMTFTVDHTTPWGSAGIKAYWTDEGGAGTETKSKFDPAQLRLKKLTALVPLTEEMLSDGAAMGSYVQRKVPEAIAWKTNEALWSGSGAGKPKGFYASTLLVSVAKETSQAADTIVAQNISKMRARMSSRSWRRAIWHVNADALPQLDNLLYATDMTNAIIYKPEGGRFGYGTLLGRDVMVTDFNETVGDKGDIVLIDWGMYRTITKSSGMETATSMHFWFDRGITAFRTIFRIDGQPAIQEPVTPNKGANTLSPIVTLDARS